VNQGVAIPISQGDAWVDGGARNAKLIRWRDSLIRAHWILPEDWEDREIEARLELEHPDGSEEYLSSTLMVDSESYPGDLNRTFWWGLTAEQAEPGLKFRVTLWETGPGFEHLPEPTGDEVWPATGYEYIGFEDDPMELKVVMVPVTYGHDCNSETYSVLEEDNEEGYRQLFIDYIHEMNPVEEILFEVREEGIDWPGELFSIAQLHGPLQDMRIQDGAGPNVYYYALLDACASGIDGAAGIAAGIPGDSPASSPQRVSAGVWLGGNSYAYETFVHEVGHTQGLRHVFCPGGGAAGTDDEYPDPDGSIITWGFAIRSFKFFHPVSTKDYMSYCQPYWVSDWTFRKTAARIETLTSWDYASPVPNDPKEYGTLLNGLLLNNGQEQWWTTYGGVDEENLSDTHTAEFEFEGAATESTRVLDQVLDDGTRYISIPLPEDFDSVSAVTRVDGGQRHDVALSIVTDYLAE
jgi:hypothetical protein